MRHELSIVLQYSSNVCRSTRSRVLTMSFSLPTTGSPNALTCLGSLALWSPSGNNPRARWKNLLLKSLKSSRRSSSSTSMPANRLNRASQSSSSYSASVSAGCARLSQSFLSSRATRVTLLATSLRSFAKMGYIVIFCQRSSEAFHFSEIARISRFDCTNSPVYRARKYEKTTKNAAKTRSATIAHCSMRPPTVSTTVAPTNAPKAATTTYFQLCFHRSLNMPRFYHLQGASA